ATKFSHAVQLLDAKHVSQITDLLKKRDYEQLKTRLIRLHGLTDKKRWQRYWSNDNLGDRTPSEFFIEFFDFESTRNSLASMTFLHYHRHGAKLSLQTDASNTAVGAVLQQHVNNSWEPLAYF